MTYIPPTWGVPVKKGGIPCNDTCVITRNYQWFLTWCNLNEINPRHPMVHFVRDAHDLLGREGFDVVIYGAYPDGKAASIEEELHRLEVLGILGQRYDHTGDPKKIRPFIV